MADGWARTTGRVGRRDRPPGTGADEHAHRARRGGQGAHAARRPGRRHAGGARCARTSASTSTTSCARSAPRRSSSTRAGERRRRRRAGAAARGARAPAGRAHDADRPAGGGRAAPATSRRPSPLPAPPAPAPAAIARAADLLQAAERPAIIAGRGAVLAGARRRRSRRSPTAPARCSRRRRWPTACSPGSPYALGIAGGFASPLAAELLADSDVVARLRRDAEPLDDAARRAARPGARAHPGRRRRRRRSAPTSRRTSAIVGDAAADAAQALLAELDARGHRATGRRTPEVAAAIAARRWRDEPYDDTPAAGHDRPADARHRPGRPAPAPTARSPSTPAPSPAGRRCTSTSPTRARGCSATPSSPSGSASAPRSARRSRGPIASRSPRVGDGGLFLALPELDTAARLGLPVLVVVWDDAAYGAEVHHFGPMGDGGRDRPVPGRRPRGDRPRRRRGGAHRPRARRPRAGRRRGRPTRPARCWSTRRSTRASPATGSRRPSATDRPISWSVVSLPALGAPRCRPRFESDSRNATRRLRSAADSERKRCRARPASPPWARITARRAGGPASHAGSACATTRPAAGP